MKSPPDEARLFDVLLIEDSEDDIRLLRLALDDATIQCRLNVVKSGRAALTYLRDDDGTDGEARPDLVLFGLSLPGTDGARILRAIRDDEKLCDIPVILLTGMGEDDIEKSASAYASRCIRKPSDRATFNHMVAAIEDICARIA